MIAIMKSRSHLYLQEVVRILVSDTQWQTFLMGGLKQVRLADWS